VELFAGLGLISFSLYFFAGAYVAARDKKWPSFMPPQMDVLAGIFSIFGERSGAWGGAVVCAIIGLGVLCGGLIAVWKSDA
jgi:hypothetical protein